MKHIKFIISAILVCVFSSVITYIITSSFIKNAKTEPINSETKTKDLYTGSLILTQNYQKCGHTISDYTLGTVSYSSGTELTQRYPGYQISAGEGEKIILSKSIDSYCPNHFFAHLKQNEIIVTRVFDNQTVTVIKTDSSFLSNNEKKLLAEGVPLNSAEALTSFIEDFTS